MSHTVFKVAILGHIKGLDGKSRAEVLPVFRAKLGEPSEVDEFDGTTCWFEYDDSDQKIVPAYSHEQKRWGLRCVFESDQECDLDFSFSIGYVHKVQKEMRELFPSIGSVIIHAYSWYTGVDEPVIFSEESDESQTLS